MPVLWITLSMTALILLMLLFEGLFGKRFSAKCRYILWTVILIRLAFPFTLPLFFVDIPTAEKHTPPVLWDAASPMGADISASFPENISVSLPEKTETAYPYINKTEETMPGHETTKHRSLEFGVLWRQFKRILTSAAVKWVWLGGAALFALVKLSTHFVCTVNLKRSLLPCNKDTYELYAKLAKKLRISHPPALYLSDRAESPLLFGYANPRILLPASLSDSGFITSNAAVVILSHELTHFRRGDLWVKLICLAARSLHWFNPFVHLAARRCTQAMELSCDEAVLSGCDEDIRRSYGNVMLDIVKRCRNRGEMLTTHFNPKKRAVKERFMNIIDTTAKRKGIAVIAAVLLICAAGCTVNVIENSPKRSETAEDADDILSVEKDLLEEELALLSEEKERLKSELAFLESERLALESMLQFVQRETDIINLKNAYELWLGGHISTEALIGGNDCVREDMASKINKVLTEFREGKNPMEQFPDPPTFEMPVTDVDFDTVPDVTPERIPYIYYRT